MAAASNVDLIGNNTQYILSVENGPIKVSSNDAYFWGDDAGDGDDEVSFTYNIVKGHKFILIANKQCINEEGNYTINKHFLEHMKKLYKKFPNFIVIDQEMACALWSQIDNGVRKLTITICSPLQEYELVKCIDRSLRNGVGRVDGHVQGDSNTYNMLTTKKSMKGRGKDEPLLVDELIAEGFIKTYSTKLTAIPFQLSDVKGYNNLSDACRSVSLMKIFCLMDPKLAFSTGVIVPKPDGAFASVVGEYHPLGGSGSTMATAMGLEKIILDQERTPIELPPELVIACENYCKISVGGKNASDEQKKELYDIMLKFLFRIYGVAMHYFEDVLGLINGLETKDPEKYLIKNLGQASQLKIKEDAPKPKMTGLMYDFFLMLIVVNGLDIDDTILLPENSDKFLEYQKFGLDEFNKMCMALEPTE